MVELIKWWSLGSGYNKWRNWREKNETANLPHKNSKLLLFENPSKNTITKMILLSIIIISLLIIIIIMIIIIIIIIIIKIQFLDLNK